MAIYKMVGERERLEEVAATSFGEEGVMERADLQRILRDQPDVLEEGLLVISEEFGNWQDSNRRIDLLALDSTGRLVVIELKRGDSGEHMDLQAIRYAAMVSTMTLQQAIDAHQTYLDRRAIDENAEGRIAEHLENNDIEGIKSENPRIVLVSEGFSPELTTCALWLNNREMQVTCIRMQLHRSGNDLLVETSQTIPLPEAHDYLVKVKEREEEVSRQRIRQVGLISFEECIETAPFEFQSDMKRILVWTEALKNENLAVVDDNGRRYGNLLIRSYRTKKPLAKVNAGEGKKMAPWLYLNAPELRLLAPKTIPALSEHFKQDLSSIDRIPTIPLNRVSDENLSALTQAYREANGRLGDDYQAES